MISTYTITPQKQLIDLNGNMKNFELNFVVTAADNSKVFETIVVDQKMLDNNEDLEYKKVTGSIGGTLIADKDVYQNYYLIIKVPEGESPHDVTVEIHKREIPPTIEELPQSQSQPPISQFKSFFSRCSNINWKTLFILIMIGLFVFVVFKFFINKKSSEPPNKSLDLKNMSPSNSSVASSYKQNSSFTSTPSNDILSRINNMQF